MVQSDGILDSYVNYMVQSDGILDSYVNYMVSGKK